MNLPAPDGCAVVSNTMVCEASRLLSGNRSPLAGRIHPAAPANNSLADLLSLIDSVVLHDRIYTLPCRLDSDTRGLEFRDTLLQGGILAELDTAPHHDAIGKLIIGGIQNVAGHAAVAGSGAGTPIDFDTSIRGELEAFLGSAPLTEQPGSSKKLIGRMNWNDTFEYPVAGGVNDVLEASQFDDFARRLTGWLDYSFSGAYESCTTVVRDMYYIYAAEFFNLPYWPQSTRAEFARAFPNYFTTDIRTALYEKLAQGFDSTLKEIAEVYEPVSAAVPPFSALALSRAAGRDELPIRILELRQEYASLRENLARIEAGRRQARTLREKKDWVDHRRKLLDEASKVFSQPHAIRLESVVRYIPEVVKPLVAPTDPTRFGANLLLQPVEWLMAWWNRRPISMLFDTGRELLALPDYTGMIGRVFGPGYVKA